MKVYANDKLCPYRTTTISAMKSRHDIDDLLAEKQWGIRKTAWDWGPEKGEVSITFQYFEVIDGRSIAPIVEIHAPTIWDKGNRRRREKINWNVSLRVMYWYIKTHLEMSYLLQSGKTMEFLPYIQVQMPTGESKGLGELLVPNVDRASLMAKALPQLAS